MGTFREPMIALSILPSIPVLWVGAVVALDGFWSAVGGNHVQLVELFVWVLGVLGVLGLILASLETTYARSVRRLAATCFLVCGVVAVLFSIYYVLGSRESHEQMMRRGTNTNTVSDTALYLFVLVWLLLLWPFFSGVQAIKKLLARGLV
jgi:glucan phosphoethanolaminetransferase (alkaline phosphatase superfamily)